ncbi:MAG: hypothetical protein Q9226_004206, partial [Calogaya cf. arnoldii]
IPDALLTSNTAEYAFDDDTKHPASENHHNSDEEFGDQKPDIDSEPDRKPDGQDFDRFVMLMRQKLPQEMIDTIEPGLLGPSKAIKAKYETRMWSENIWVINTGEADDSMAFLLQLPDDAREKYIQNVHLNFTICDANESGTGLQHPKHGLVFCAKMIEPKPKTEDIDADGSLSKAKDDSCHRPFGIWWKKWILVDRLPLRHLLLDFSKCYDLGDRWRGNLLVEIMASCHKPSASDVRIFAPDELIASYIHAKVTRPD